MPGPADPVVSGRCAVGSAWPDAQGWDLLGFALVTAEVVGVNRKSMLSRGTAAIDVLMQEPAATSLGDEAGSTALNPPRFASTRRR